MIGRPAPLYILKQFKVNYYNFYKKILIYCVAVHGQAGDAVEEVCEGQVDNEDCRVFERSSVEAKDPVRLRPGDGQEGQEVTQGAYHRHDDTPGH